jgi:hypothetical protein
VRVSLLLLVLTRQLRFLSRADEVNLHLQVHLRAHGIIPHMPVDPNAAAPVPDKLKGGAGEAAPLVAASEEASAPPAPAAAAATSDAKP